VGRGSIFAFAVGFLIFSGVASAQQFPTRPIFLMAPFAPGGTIGADIVAKAPPDRHTLLIASMGLAANAVLYTKLPYDMLKDLAPVTLVDEQPNIVVVHPSVSAKSMGELLALARAKPGQISYGSGGIGSTSHLVTVLFLQMAKLDMLHIPCKGLDLR